MSSRPDLNFDLGSLSSALDVTLRSNASESGATLSRSPRAPRRKTNAERTRKVPSSPAGDDVVGLEGLSEAATELPSRPRAAAASVGVGLGGGNVGVSGMNVGGSTGVGKLAPVQMYVIQEEDKSRLCLAVFGKKCTKLCLQEAMSDNGFCGASSHKQKAEIRNPNGAIYCIPIQATGGSTRKTALVNPTASENEVDAASLEILRSELKTSAEWLFFIVNELKYVDDDLDDDSYTESIASHSSTALSYDSLLSGDGEVANVRDMVPNAIQLTEVDQATIDSNVSAKALKAFVEDTRTRLAKFNLSLQGLSIADVKLKKKVQAVCDDLGTLSLLPLDPTGQPFGTVTEAIESLMATIQVLKTKAEDSKKLRLEDVEWVNRSLSTVNTNIQAACVQTSEALKKHIDKELRSSPFVPGGGGTQTSIDVDAPLQGLNSLLDPGTVRDLVVRLVNLEEGHDKLQADHSKLQADHSKLQFDHANTLKKAVKAEKGSAEAKVVATDLRSTVRALNSGVGCLEHNYSCPQDVKDALRRVGMESSKAYQAFNDACSLLRHGQSADKKTSDKAADFKLLENSGFSQLAFTVIEGCQERMVAPYSGTATSYESDKPLYALTSKETWNGRNSSGGQKGVIQKLIKSSAKKATVYIEQNLPVGELRALATSMVSASKDFHDAIVLHFDEEYMSLTQNDFKGKDVLQYLSDQFAKIFESFYDIRCHAHSTTEVVDDLERLSQYIWLTIKCHDKMAEFLRDGILNHQLMQSALSRFSALHSAIKPSDIVSLPVLEKLTKGYEKEFKELRIMSDQIKAKADAAFAEAKANKVGRK